MLAAEGPSDLETAVRLAQEFNLKFVLNHISHSRPMLDYIASLKVPVIVGPIYETPKEYERYDAVYSLPAELYKRGVKIAFRQLRRAQLPAICLTRQDSPSASASRRGSAQGHHAERRRNLGSRRPTRARSMPEKPRTWSWPTAILWT